MLTGISFFEDFVEASDDLVVSSNPTGSQTRLDKPGGILQLTTGSSSGDFRGLETVKQIVGINGWPTFGGRVKLNQSQKAYFFLGFSEIGTGNLSFSSRWAGLYVDAPGLGAPNWQGASKQSPNASLVDLGVPVTTDEVDLRVETDPKILRFYINGAFVGSVTQESAIPIGLMRLIVSVVAGEAVAKSVEIDNVWLSADR